MSSSQVWCLIPGESLYQHAFGWLLATWTDRKHLVKTTRALKLVFPSSAGGRLLWYGFGSQVAQTVHKSRTSQPSERLLVLRKARYPEEEASTMLFISRSVTTVGDALAIQRWRQRNA